MYNKLKEMFEEKIKELFNSGKNPFLLELQKRHELERIQKDTYKKVKGLFDLLFYFCEENKILREKPFEIKDKFIFTEGRYLYFVSLPSCWCFALNNWEIINPQIRVKYSEITENYIFEYSYNNFRDENSVFTIIENEKYDLSFNYMILGQISSILDMLFGLE